MIIDTIRHGKPVQIEVDRKDRIIAARVEDPEPKQSKITKAMRRKVGGKPIGKWLTFAIAVVSALRFENKDDPEITRARTNKELAELYGVILDELGLGLKTCSKQNVSRIEQVALRKLKRTGSLSECLESFTGKMS